MSGSARAGVDAALLRTPIVFEYESYEWHTAKRALVRDSRRRNALLAAGYLPISVTWEDLRTGGQQVCADVLRILLRTAA